MTQEILNHATVNPATEVHHDRPPTPRPALCPCHPVVPARCRGCSAAPGQDSATRGRRAGPDATSPGTRARGGCPACGFRRSASPFLSGTTEAHRKSTLTPKVSSAVTRVHVREGDIVKQNQPLVTLDTRDFVLRAQQAEAARDGAKVQLDAAKLDWDRIKSLLAEKAVPQSQFDMIDARYKGAKAGLAAAETAVAMAPEGPARLGGARAV